MILRDADLVLCEIDTFVILRPRRPFFPALQPALDFACRICKLLELAVIGLFAGRLVVIQYRLMLKFSLIDNPMMAQMIAKNVGDGEYRPDLDVRVLCGKTWRCFLFVMGPVSLLPSPTWQLLSYWHPVTMGWLWARLEAGRGSLALAFQFRCDDPGDSRHRFCIGAHLITRLRHQVAEARQLGQYRLRRQIGAGGWARCTWPNIGS